MGVAVSHCDGCCQGFGWHCADRAGPWRDRHLHQGRAISLPAPDDLHAEHSRPQVRDAYVVGAGLVMTGHAVLTPLLPALSMLVGDFVTCRAQRSSEALAYPNTWRVRNLTLTAIPLGLSKVSYCVGLPAAGWFLLHLSTGEMRTLTFLMLVLAGKANVYVRRERRHFWRSHPAWVMIPSPLTRLSQLDGQNRPSL